MNIREITSTANPEVKGLKPLFTSARERRNVGKFVAEGRSLCTEAAKAGLVRELWFTEKHREFALKTCPGAGLTLMSEAVAKRLTDQKSPQGIFALCDFPPEREGETPSRLVGLFDIADPVNAGAMVRTALSLGYGGAVSAGESADLFSPKALRGGMGAQLFLPVIRFSDTLEATEFFASMDYCRIAAALTPKAAPLSEVKPNIEKLLLIFGNEGSGLSPQVVDRCTPVIIPMSAGFDSLNAAVAAGIFMWHFRKQ